MEYMGGKFNLSAYELMVLLGVLRAGANAYGVPIAREIEQRSGREVTLSGVYAALNRLKDQGLVSALRGEATAERGGRAKTYFKLTPRGLKEVRLAQQALTSLWEGLAELR
jgi:PadR family transcriptional regulator PadR